MFNGTHDCNVFIGQANSHETHNSSGESGIDIILAASTPEAAVDAGERDYEPACCPGTREQYIKDVTSWATTSDSDQLPVYWMKGPAGVGKSAIAQTCAKAMKDSGHLGAAFFFSVNGPRKDHTRFFPTLAYQLATILPDYREVVNRRVLNDKTLVTKTMSSQFESLIVEPLRALKEQGKEVPRRPIFIDGLDECESQDAQAEIIKLIAASAQAKSTPFCWAIFSRADLRIVATFALTRVSSLCQVVYLPISRDTDRDIEIYLRDGFKHMLQRRNMVLSSPWPAEEDIRKLIDAAAGLFAYAATVLRFIDKHSHAGFKETLQAVLDVITEPDSHSLPVFSNLDNLYALILQRVPDEIRPSMNLLLRWMAFNNRCDQSWNVAFVCNFTGISEATFKIICHYIQAIVVYQEPSQSIQELFPTADLAQAFYHQDSSFKFNDSVGRQLLKVHGSILFLHKSFPEFLNDPTRSSAFYVQSTWLVDHLWQCCARQYLHLTSGYVIEGSRLKLAPGTTSSSTLLSWPQGSELIDSFFTLHVMQYFSGMFQFVWPMTVSSDSRALVRKLDHRKSLIARGMIHGLGWHGHPPERLRIMEDTTLMCVLPDDDSAFDSEEFQLVLKKAKKAGVIKAFHPRAPSPLASMNNLYFRYKPGKRHGLYKLGRGEKSVIWYWEYDTKKQYFHQFMAVDYEKAMRIYEVEKFEMWNEGPWVQPACTLEI